MQGVDGKKIFMGLLSNMRLILNKVVVGKKIFLGLLSDMRLILNKV